MIRILGTVFGGLLGLAFGSFLNVCLTRWPEGESVVGPGSHCRNCPRTLAWWENVPLVSWLALRGRCRGCRAWIGWRYPLVEAAVGGLWAFIAWREIGVLLLRTENGALVRDSGLAVDVQMWVGLALLVFLLVGLAGLDAEHLWLPDAVTLSGIAAGIVYSLSLLWEWAADATVQLPIWRSIALYFAGVVAAPVLVLLIRGLYWVLRRREGIGLGDVKLMALLAAWLGFPGALLSFVLGVVLGAVVGLVVLAVPADRRVGDSWALIKLPLGTFLCVGGIVSALWGDRLLAIYLSWAGL